MDKLARSRLTGQAHSLNPAVTIAGKGMNENVCQEIEAALKANELVKIKFSGFDRTEKKAMATRICEDYKAELVQLVGNIVVIFRLKPKVEPIHRKPSRIRKKPRSSSIV